MIGSNLVIDAYNEVDLLEIRMGELDAFVDKFVITEGTETFSGLNKPLYLTQHWDRFRPWWHKIHYDVCNLWGIASGDAWTREHYQRDHLARAVIERVSSSPKDVVIFSDVDEIPKPGAITHVVTRARDGTYFGLNGNLSYYWVNCVSGWQEDYCRVGNVDRLGRSGGEGFRRGLPDFSIANAAWHFSCLGNPAVVALKLKSFAHTEYGSGRWVDPERIEACMLTGQDIVDRPHMRFSIEPLDESYPAYLRQNICRFKHLVRGEVKGDIGIT